MKRLLTLVAFFATLQASAQQVNPVPDYVFANRMSAGRNTVTDTAAYFSIGPRYGATRGMMPPMVVDTASFSANKRNGLLIFSIQKNKFLYWDSVGVKWAEMAGTAGTALTSADTAALLSTRAWRQKGIDSLAAIRIAGSGTTNYVSKFTASSTIGNSQIFDNGTSVGVGTTSPSTKLHISNAGTTNIRLQNTSSSGLASIELIPGNQTDPYFIYVNETRNLYFQDFASARLAIFSTGRIGINTTSDAGFQTDNNGTLRSGTITVNTNGQNRTIGNYYGANSDGNNFWVGGGGLNSVGQVGNTILGSRNSAYGISSLFANTQGYSNTAIGFFAGYNNTTGYQNVSIGDNTLYTNVTGVQNTAVGTLALFGNDQSRNIAIGFQAGRYTILDSSNNGSDSSVYVGWNVKSGGQTSTNEVIIGFQALGKGSNTVVIGNSSVTNNYFTGNINTSAPTGGSSKPWRLGEVATVSPTSPNRTIRVEIDGTVYYIHAKTTND